MGVVGEPSGGLFLEDFSQIIAFLLVGTAGANLKQHTSTILASTLLKYLTDS
jgi:hypothetical protein